MYFISIFQVFSYYWRHWYSKFQSGFGALVSFESCFDINAVTKKTSSIPLVTAAYLKHCSSVQQVHIKDIQLSTSAVSISKPPAVTQCKVVFPNVVLKPTFISSRPSTSNFVPKTEPIEVIVNPSIDQSVFSLPDQNCHKRLFSSSVIRVPYLVFDNVTKSKITTMPSRPSASKPKRSLRPSVPKVSKKRSLKNRLFSCNDTPINPSLKFIKLEQPEVFVAADHGYQYVCRPEFSDDESSLVITISSDSD